MIEAVFGDAMTAARELLDKTKMELAALSCPKPTGPFRFHLHGLGNKGETEFLANFPGGYAKADRGTDHIYVFSLVDGSPAAFASFSQLFEVARQENNKEAAYCRFIKEHASTTTLYVGRSQKLRSRIAQHLDAKAGRTYAMHMGRWAKELDLEIAVSFITFRNRSDTLVQAVEDGLWMALEPALGKHGRK